MPKTAPEHVRAITSKPRQEWRSEFEKVPESLRDDVLRGIQVVESIRKHEKANRK